MKKAKIMLAAIAVLAVLGGTAALKAKAKFSGITYYTTAISGAQATHTVLDASFNPSAPVKFYTTVFNGAATLSGRVVSVAE